jgi:hypothetical protein
MMLMSFLPIGVPFFVVKAGIAEPRAALMCHDPVLPARAMMGTRSISPTQILYFMACAPFY